MDIRNLYKAKSARNGEWCIGSLLQRKDEYYICPLSGIYTVEFSNEEDLYEFGGFVLVDKDTICRCTGLVGKKDGNIIYENDVIKYHFGNAYAQIRYGAYQSCFDSKKTEHIGFYVDWPESRNYRKDLGYWINMVNAEVVGNVFDNPELLEGGE
jgi:uncharacterized phage protein (TIGR01671 family)